MRKVSFFILLVLLSLQAGAQTFKQLDHVKYLCHYYYEYQQDSSSIASKKGSDMVLLIGNQHSLFTHSSTPLRDSLLLQYKNDDPNAAALKILPQLMGNRPSFFTSYSICKTSNSDQIDFYEKVAHSYLKISSINKFNWKLNTAKDTILLGLKCKMATTTLAGRCYNAWYTTEIPINDGPYKFKGLPGLIIKLHDNRNQHSFELTSIEQITYTKPILLQEENYLDVEMKDYIKAKKADIEARIKKYADPQRLQVSPEELGKIEARLRNRNNFIERL